MMIFPNLSLFEFDHELFNKKFLNIVVSIFPIVEKHEYYEYYSD